MRLLKFLIAGSLIAVILSVSPAYAGMDKTDEAWIHEVSRVNDSVKDKAALAKVSEMKSVMTDGYGDLEKSDFYELASKMFKKLTVLSAKHGGVKVNTPSWID